MKGKLDKAIALMEQAGFLQEQVLRACELRKRFDERRLVISVIGQFKRGKSSLINTMLGDELLPVGIVPLTTAVTEVRRGDKFRAVVIFGDGTENVIKRKELPNYISEQENPGNRKNVVAVRLWTENTPFGSSINLVDTPGVGSLHTHNTETSYQYVENSDAVLFVLSVDSPVSVVERDFLLRAGEHAAKFYFAVNKVDTVDERDLRKFLSYCKQALSEVAGPEVVLYPVSAKTGNGVQLLIERLSQDLHASHDRLLVRSLSIKLQTVTMQAKAKIALFLKAAAMPKDELETKLLRIRERQSSLTEFSDEMEVLTRRQTKRLVEGIREKLEARIAGFQSNMQKQAKNLYFRLQALPSREFERRLLMGFEDIVHDRLTRLNTEGMAMLEEGYASIVKELNEKAEESARFISDVMKDQFGQDYPIFARDFRVSKRSDFFIKLDRNKNLLLDTDVLLHLLPKNKANKKIYERATKQMFDDLERNKNNMVYNYGYKMQESLRTLCSGLTADILQMRHELDELFHHLAHSQSIESHALLQTEKRLVLIARRLDELK